MVTPTSARASLGCLPGTRRLMGAAVGEDPLPQLVDVCRVAHTDAALGFKGSDQVGLLALGDVEGLLPSAVGAGIIGAAG